MEARFKLRYTDEHLIESNRRFQRVSRWRLVRLALRALFLLVLAALIAVCLHEKQPGPALAIALSGVAFMLLPRLTDAVTRWHFRKSPFRNEELELVFSPDGMRAKGQNQDARMGWTIYTAAHEYPDGILLMQGPGVFTWVPDRAAADSLAKANLRELVRAHVPRFRPAG